MKLLMLTDRMDAGGAETHVATLSQALARAGAEVTVLSAGGRAADALERRGVRVLRTPAFSHAPWRLLRIYLLLWRLCRRERFDVLHAHARLPALLCALLPRTVRPVTAVTVHARFSSAALSRRLSRWGDHTVAVSEDLRVYTARTFSLPYGRIRVIPNGIDLSVFSPAGRVPLADCAHRILFASRLDADCALGARLLCRILPRLSRRFPDVTLTVAGGGSATGEIAALAARVNRALSRPAVTLVGHVDAMETLYRTHAAFVGVSRAAMEAAACGCAVLLLGDEGSLGILDGSTAALAAETNLTCRGTRPPTAAALERELTRLLGDPNAREHAATEGARLVSAQFNITDAARAHLALYRATVKNEQAKRILIGGYYGSGNLGDDMILAGTSNALSAVAPDVRLTALTGHGGRDATRFGIPCVRRRSPLSIRRAMKRAHLFLCGGGSLLQNKTSNRSLLYYLSLLHTAHATGTVPVLWAAGIGPLTGERARERVRRALSLCGRISLRDPDSAALLRRIGVEEPLHLGADPALLYPLPSPAFCRAVLDAASLTSVPYFCIVLNGGSPLSPALLLAVRELTHRHALKPLLLVLDRNRDRGVSARAARLLSAPLLSPDPDTLLALLSHGRFVLCERLHAMILSSSVSTPALCLLSEATDPKLPAFAAISGQAVCDATDARAILLAAERLLEHPCAERIRAGSETLRKKAKKDLENVVRMLYNIDSTTD